MTVSCKLAQVSTPKHIGRLARVATEAHTWYA